MALVIPAICKMAEMVLNISEDSHNNYLEGEEG
jgi:hypothetical protein